MKRLSIFFLAGILTLAMASAAMGGLLDFGKSLEGTVKEVAAGLIVITHEDPENNAISEVAIEINEKTKFEEVGSLAELKQGDQVKVKYTLEEDKMIATLVAKIEAQQERGTQRLQL